jgi:hypothetical protein
MGELDVAKTSVCDGDGNGNSNGSDMPPRDFAMGSESTAASLPSTANTDTPMTMTDDNDGPKKPEGPIPVAICGMATRLPGGISSAEQLWEFLLNKGDACARIPTERYGTHPPPPPPPRLDEEVNGTGASTISEKPHWKTHGYMLNHVDLAAFDSALFTMTRAELAIVDPQQRILLELAR